MDVEHPVRMLTHSGLSRMSGVLGEGFFADNVVRSFRRKDELKTEKKALLEKILEYISIIENGKEQVSTGRLRDNAIKSISAYKRMLSIIVRMDIEERDQGVIDKLTEEIRNEVTHTLQSKRINPEKLQNTISFFQYLREATLQESASSFGWESELLSRQEGAP